MMRTLVTIGPASLDQSSIKNFAEKTNLFRLNGSHSDLTWHQHAIDMIRSVRPSAFILLDIPGIKPRTANNTNILIKKGEIVAFGTDYADKNVLSVRLTKALPIFGEDLTTFSLNDGQFIFDVVGTDDGVVVGKSRESFELLPKKGINLPGSIYDDKKQLSIYSDFIDQVRHFKIDGLGISFIQTGSVISELKRRYPEYIYVSKIENSAGWANAEEIVEKSDAIMIDRGDLAAEVGFNSLYRAVSQIALSTKKFGKPLIMATENLESMIDRDSPSKSEVMSLGHSNDIGSDCIMLSEETALSQNGKVIVDWLDNFFVNNVSKLQGPLDVTLNKNTNPIWRAASEFQDLSYVMMSKSGYALWQFFSHMPDSNVILITGNKKLKKLVQLYRSDIKILEPDSSESDTPSDIVWNTINKNREVIFDASDTVAAISVSKYVRHSRANSITIYTKYDFTEN